MKFKNISLLLMIIVSAQSAMHAMASGRRLVTSPAARQFSQSAAMRSSSFCQTIANKYNQMKNKFFNIGGNYPKTVGFAAGTAVGVGATSPFLLNYKQKAATLSNEVEKLKNKAPASVQELEEQNAMLKRLILEKNAIINDYYNGYYSHRDR